MIKTCSFQIMEIPRISRISSLIMFFAFLRTLQGVEREVRTISTSNFETNCSSLQVEQYFCSPEIDPSTQQPKGCSRNNLAYTICMAADGIQCVESGNNTFPKEIPCLWTNGYSFETSLLLSVFLGMFGADRFYLGYPAIGLFKLCTLGCMFLGQIVDIILIATQTVGPADGSHYVINYFGPRLSPLELDNETYRMPQFDWPEL